MHKSLLMALSLLLAGCTTLIPANPDSRPPNAIPADVIAQLGDTAQIASFTIVASNPGDGETWWEVTGEADTPLRFKYLRSEMRPNTKHHLVLIYNILSDKKEIISHLLADGLMEKGFDCIIVQQEHLLNRRWARPIVPDPENKHTSFDQYNAHLARNVGRILRQWIPQQPNLTGDYGFVGASLGGMHAVGAAALFPEAKLTVAIMAGGDNLDLFKQSQEYLVVRTRERLLDEYASRLAKEIPARTDYTESLDHDIAGLAFGIIKMARCVDTTKIKVMISTNDTSVPTSCQWRLFYALGNPEARLFPCGHYTLALYYFVVKQQLQDWMMEAFGVKPGRPHRKVS